MIRINTIFNNKDWKLHLSNPNNFIQKKIDKINKKFKKYEDKVIFLHIIIIW